MSSAHRLTCLDCKHSWVGYPFDTKHAEKCPECGSEWFEVGKEYSPSSIQSFWLLLIIPNVVLWLC